MAARSSERLLAIDPGSERAGFAILEGRATAPAVVSSGTIYLDKKDPLPSRLLQLSQDLETLIKKYRPSSLAIETAFFAKNARSALTLGQVRGVVLVKAAEHALDIREITPAEVKVAIAGSGRAQKDQIATMVRLLLKLPKNFVFESEDHSDALAIGLAALQTGVHNRLSAGKQHDRSSFWKNS